MTVAMDEATLPAVVPLRRVLVRDATDVAVVHAPEPPIARVPSRCARYEISAPATGRLVDVYG